MARKRKASAKDEQAKLAAEVERANNDPLTFYTENPIENFAQEIIDPTTKEKRIETFRLGPGPTALACWRDLSLWRLLAGGNRCLAADQQIYDPVLGLSRPVAEITGPFHVLAWDTELEQAVVTPAEAPFVKPPMSLFEIRLSNGQSIRCTMTHQVLCDDGDYHAVLDVLEGYDDAHLRTISDSALPGSGADVRRCLRTHAGFPDDYRPSRRLCDRPLRIRAAGDPAPSPSPDDARERNRGPAQQDVPADKSGYIRTYQPHAHPSNLGAGGRSGVQFGMCADPGASPPSPRAAVANPWFPQPSIAFASRPQSVAATGQPQPLTAGTSVTALACPSPGGVVDVIGVELIGRAAVYDFTVPTHHNYICSGIVNHNSGKSAHTMAETAAYARGLHPWRPSKGAKWPDARPVTILVLITTKMQAKEVWADRLLKNCKLRGPCYAKPLIPADEIATDDRDKPKITYTYSGTMKIPSQIELANGSRIMFYWSGPEHSWQRLEGIAFDAVVRDESTGNENMMKELRMRLLEAQCDTSLPHAGWFLWCATNTKDSPEFEEFTKLCHSGTAGHAAYVIGPDENPAITMDKRIAMAATMDSEDAAVRVYGTGGYVDRLKIFAAHFDKEKVMAPARPLMGNENIWVGFDPAFGRLGSKMALLYALLCSDNPMRICVDKVTIERNWTLMDAVRDIVAYAGGRPIEGIVADPSILKTEGRGQSVYTQFCEEIQHTGVVSYRGVMVGRNRKDDTYPVMLSYLERGLYAFNEADPGCVELASQFQSARRKDATRYSGDKGVVDKKLDALAALRYLTSVTPAWIDRGRHSRAEVAGETFTEALPRLIDDAVTPPSTLSEEEAQHLTRLRQSAQQMRALQPRRPSWHLRTVTCR